MPAGEGEYEKEQKASHERGTHVLQGEEKNQGARNGSHDRQGVIDPRKFEPREPTRNEILFAELPEPFPIVREITGQKEDQQELDKFNGLHPGPD